MRNMVLFIKFRIRMVDALVTADGCATTALIGKDLKVVFDKVVPVADAHDVNTSFGDSSRTVVTTLKVWTSWKETIGAAN